MMGRDDSPRSSRRWWETWHISKDENDRYIEAKRSGDMRVPRIGAVAQPKTENERAAGELGIACCDSIFACRCCSTT